mmetsp:Transcript_34821/g.81573  ORF Transcript_34821/g.81573 Transcript_34821/m.81573 type:complete len:108 (-) Transcript_34821:86-409(-)
MQMQMQMQMQMVVIGQCLGAEVRKCETEVHWQALRKAEMCSRLWRQIDESSSAHALHRAAEARAMAAEVQLLEEGLGRERADSQAALRDVITIMSHAQQRAVGALHQ